MRTVNRRDWIAFAAITALAAGLFCLRLAAPPNLLDQDQERPAAYVLDAVKNGHWLCQRDLSGDITSKPPLWTWLSALTTLACGRISVFSLYLPGALSFAGTAWLILAVARKHFGLRAALFGALASMLTTAGLKEFGLARTDGVFAFTVTAAALLAFRAWMAGRGWLWFWLMAAAATLAKGPLGLALAGGGLLACWWESREREPVRLRGSHWMGLGCFLVLTVGWLALSYQQFGDPVLTKLLNKELQAQAVGTRGAHWPGTFFWQPSLYYLSRAAPWSLLACYGLWRIWRGRPRKRPVEGLNELNELNKLNGLNGRAASIGGAAAGTAALQSIRFERFVFWWFVFGLVLFSLAPHQRADLLWPIMPAGAMIAGLELDRLTPRWRRSIVYGGLAILVTLAVGGFAFYYFGPRARTSIVRQTVAVKALAAELERRAGREFPLTHVDDPMTLQIYLNTLRPRVSTQRAAQLLRGPEAAFVAVNNLTALEAERSPNDPPIYTLLSEHNGLMPAPARIISNRPDLRLGEPIAFCFGSWLVQMRGAQLLSATEREFWFAAGAAPGEAVITNESGQPRRIRACVSRRGPPIRRERVLGAHAQWALKIEPR